MPKPQSHGGDDAAAVAHRIDRLADPVGDDLGMLDEVRLGIDDARQQQELGRQLRPLQRRILVLMARVGELDAERADLAPGSSTGRMSASGTSWMCGPS